MPAVQERSSKSHQVSASLSNQQPIMTDPDTLEQDVGPEMSKFRQAQDRYGQEDRFPTLPPGRHFQDLCQQLRWYYQNPIETKKTARIHETVIVTLSCNDAAAQGDCEGSLCHDWGQQAAQTWDWKRPKELNRVRQRNSARWLFYCGGKWSTKQRKRWERLSPAERLLTSEAGNQFHWTSLDTPVVPILVATGLITTTKCIQLRASSVAKAASAFKGAFLYFYQATMIYMDLKDLFANCAGTDGRQQVFICRPGDEDDLIEIKCQKVDVESCWLSDYVIKGSDSEIRLMKKLYRLWMEESPIMLWRPIYQVLMSTTIITGRADGDQYADDRPGEAEMGKFHADATGSARSTRKRKANPGTDLNERAAKRAKHQSSSTSNGNSNGDSSDSDGSSDSSDDSSSDASSDSEEDVLARMDADLKISLDPLPARSAKSKKKAKSLAYTPRRKPLKPGGNFPCPVAKQTNCKEKFTTSSHSHRHVRNKHPGLSRFTCRYCKATFTTSQQLADHKISQHNMDSVRRPEELPRHQSPDGSTSMDDNDRIALQGENAAGRYIYQSSGRWTQDEHDCLEEALANYKGERTKMYSTIHRLHGPKGTTDTRLRNRTPDQIGDYARTQLGVARLIKAWKWTEEAKHTFKEGYARFCKEKYVWKLIRVAYPDVLGEHDYLDMVDQAKKLGLI